MGALLSEPVTAMVVEKSSSESLAATAVTMQGWRKTHEDEHILRCDCGVGEECGVFAVLDGHGGQTAARVASGSLQELLSGIARQGTLDAPAAERALKDAFVEADAQLRAELPQEDRSGTTVVSAIITRPRPGEYCVQLAHCGDSRAVLRVGRRLVCSSDHKPGRDDETRRIQAAGGTVEQGPLGGGPLRVDGALAVSRAMGDFHFKPADLTPAECKVTAVPEVQTVGGCSVGDWLLLACDGVFDVMENVEVDEFISARVQKAAPAPVDGGRVLSELLQLCLDRGSKDNCTACLVQILEPGIVKPSPEPSRALLRGKCESAAPEVRDKYAEFFEAHGFAAEARALSRAAGSRPSAAPAGRGAGPAAAVAPAAVAPPPRAPGGGSAPPAGARQQIAALAKAMQAMRSSRTIQAAWRARRGGKEGGDSGPSAS